MQYKRKKKAETQILKFQQAELSYKNAKKI